MPRRRIRRFLLKYPKTIIVILFKEILLYPVLLLFNWITSLDFIILERMARWIKQGITFCGSILSIKIKIKLWIVLLCSLFLITSLIGPYVSDFYREIPKTVIESIAYLFKEIVYLIKTYPVIAWVGISFVIMVLVFEAVRRTIGFVWTVILESSLVASLLIFAFYGISQLLSDYCKIGFCNKVSSLFENILSYDPRIIFPFIFTVFIPLYSYILRRKRNFIVVRNENFFGLKEGKVVFRFSMTNNSKRTRIIKRVFLLVNNNVTFLIKDYEEVMLTLSPKEKFSLEMEAKTFKKDDKFYFIKGNEKLSSAYLFFEMLDGYWGRKLKLTSPISKIMLSSYRFKGGFLISVLKAKIPQPLIWNEKRKK